MTQAIDQFPPITHDWRGTVLVWDEQAIFYGEAADATLHESPAIKLCVSIARTFGISIAEDETVVNFDSAIIAAGQPHAIDGRQNRMVMLLLATETELAQPLAPIISRNGVTPLSRSAVKQIRTIFSGFDDRLASGASVEGICGEIVNAVASGSSLPIDPRVAQSIEWIKSSRDEGISVAEIARGVELSESRFSHLFTEYVRVPVRRYLLWLRLRDAMHLLAQNKSLTEIAHEAGFADSAHLTRSFRSMLGIAPSALRESKIISFLR